jgi:hypothetical protein
MTVWLNRERGKIMTIWTAAGAERAAADGGDGNTAAAAA